MEIGALFTSIARDSRNIRTGDREREIEEKINSSETERGIYQRLQPRAKGVSPVNRIDR